MRSMAKNKPTVEEVKQLILAVTNDHCEECGIPPKIDLDAGLTAYVENELGEQMFFQKLPEEDFVRFYHGDCGWRLFRITWFRRGSIVLEANPEPDDHEPDPRLLDRLNATARKIYGKPRLTDAECAMVLGQPNVASERQVINAIYRLWMHPEDPL